MLKGGGGMVVGGGGGLIASCIVNMEDTVTEGFYKKE